MPFSGAERGAAAEHPGSGLLTRQLQELWRRSRGGLAPQRLLFEVTSASVVSERSSKYVVSERGAGGGAGAGPYFSLSLPVLLGRCRRLR